MDIKDQAWLEASISVHTWSTNAGSKSGRPSKRFAELSDRSKRRKTAEMGRQVPANQLTYAASNSQRTSGNTDASKIIKAITASPTQTGFGKSSCANTSRRFFSDPEATAEITGIDLTIIQKLKIILEFLSSVHKIDEIKFIEFVKETAMHPMSSTLHKILVHAATVTKHAIIPIGQMSEEAAEARSKHVRFYRQDYARKFSRTLCNKDVLNRLLLTSDPFLSLTRKRQTHKSTQPFSSKTMNLLLQKRP
ncbi:hypothetical protein ILUMI_19484 [Ignelater luminosus]|uniref:Uncharacterized protein n=1 Tax=Ignelater luminosus TaxID=2038154 RepID=A0A8K0CG48_IGNLU|nr:hypothetical protein ILUMI_19484 [Ignelater luminosus]